MKAQLALKICKVYNNLGLKTSNSKGKCEMIKFGGVGFKNNQLTYQHEITEPLNLKPQRITCTNKSLKYKEPAASKSFPHDG